MSIRPGLDLPHLRHQHHHPPQGHHAVKYNIERNKTQWLWSPAKVHLDAEIRSDNECDM